VYAFVNNQRILHGKFAAWGYSWMKRSSRWLALLVFTIAAARVSGQNQTHKQVAVTVDDLPYVTGSDCDPQEVLSITERLLKPLREAKVPVLGLVAGTHCRNLTRRQRALLLQMWLDAGAELGNHTWSHSDLNKVSLKEYEHDILVMDDELHRTIPSTKVRYFRAPYLHDGATHEVKKELQAFLRQHGYTEAPVTIDNNDWVFAAAYSRALQEKNADLADQIGKAYIPYMGSVIAYFEKRSRDVVGRECPQTLLIHASKLNARMLPQLLEVFKSREYAFVTIDDVMRDDCYSISDSYIGPKGLSWIHRWGLTRGKDIEMEPSEPEWIDRLGKQPAP
jgi:peptidoglycan-N-acetylglucosamine deacetylase